MAVSGAGHEKAERIACPLETAGPRHVKEYRLTAPDSRSELVAAIRASLDAQLERLLSRPIIARVQGTEGAGEDDGDVGVPGVFRALRSAARAVRTGAAWRRDPDDGSFTVAVDIDYDDLWHGREREVRETVSNTIEQSVALLTDAQRTLLEHSPREFLDLYPPPETSELVSFETDNVGGSVRVVELRLDEAPESPAHLRHVAIVPNLVQIERQLAALREIEAATDDGPLGPLRALVGLADPAALSGQPAGDRLDESRVDGHLDEHQRQCIDKAITTPHFAVIEGPPGSGKTTVITNVIRQVLARGERVLVVSPTHVAVDNVVGKLVPTDPVHDDLSDYSMPVRYAARPNKLSAQALAYWVGAKKQRRGATIARRVQQRLVGAVPIAEVLFRLENKDAPGRAPLSSAIARHEAVICGTPIGILSHEAVKCADPGAFGVLIVDEVSKMTLPAFLAIAVKARRWVVVGDPAQLPPFNDSEENGTALNDLLPSLLELACSVGAVLERAKPHLRRDERIIVVASDPERARVVIEAHLQQVMGRDGIAVATLDDAPSSGVVVCGPADVDEAIHALDDSRAHRHGVRLLIERDLDVDGPETGRGARLVEPRLRAPAMIFENAFNVYHAQPWANRSKQRLPLLSFRNGLEKCLPSKAAINACHDLTCTVDRSALVQSIATRFAVTTVSVYDWLTGIPTAEYDCSPLVELSRLSSLHLCAAVWPFVGGLKKQYRMVPSLSAVPRELFYFGEALHDGEPEAPRDHRVVLVQVAPEDARSESNIAEVDAVCEILSTLRVDSSARGGSPEIMVITPYREQETALSEALGSGRFESLGAAAIEVCTLDRCQGREADYVLISLVRSKAGPFFDMPKRWNVALTRARQGLFIVGNVDAYLREAADARRESSDTALQERRRGSRADARPRMSLLARVLEAYAQQERQAARRDRSLATGSVQ